MASRLACAACSAGRRPRTSARVRLQQSGREERNQEGVDTVDPAEDARVTTANNGIGEEVPGNSDARTDSSVERVIGVFGVALDVADGRETEGWSISLALKSGLLYIIQVLFGIYDVVVLVHENGLESASGLIRRLFDRIANAEVQGELRLHAPTVGPVATVSRYDAGGRHRRRRHAGSRGSDTGDGTRRDGVEG